MGFLNDEDSQKLYWLAQPVKIEGSSDLWIVLDVIPSRREITLTVARLDGSGRRTVPSVACKIQDFRRLARRYAPTSTGMAKCNLVLNERTRTKNSLQKAIHGFKQQEQLGFKESVNRRKKRHERQGQEFAEKLQQGTKRTKQR